jgi:hypothetical protein
MTAGGVAQRPVGRVEHHQGERGRAQRRRPASKGIGSLEHADQVGLGGEQLGQHGAQLPDRRRGGCAVAHDIADGKCDAAARERDRVEPVTTRRLLMPGDQVASRDPRPWQHRQRGGQQGFGQFLGCLAGGLVPSLRVGRTLLRVGRTLLRVGRTLLRVGRTLLRVGRTLLSGLPLRHAVGDIGGDDQQAINRAARVPPGQHPEIGVCLLDPVGDLRPPLLGRFRLPGRVHPVHDLDELLPVNLGERVPVRHADHV